MIEFGDWQVRRADALNLTLYHRHAAKSGKNVGEVGWHQTGHFFHSVEAAVTYALKADARAMVGGEEERLGLAEYVGRMEKLVEDYREWLSGATESS